VVDRDILDQFECNGCGDCCRWGGLVCLTGMDISRLAGHLGLSEIDFIEKYTRLAPDRKQLALHDQSDGSCAFLEGNRCGIYDARPTQCRTFPFSWSVSEGCPVLDGLLALRENNVETVALNAQS